MLVTRTEKRKVNREVVKVLKTAFDILGFDPKDPRYQCLMIDITPVMAQYILDNHNKDNRKITKSQISAIRKSIKEDGWLNMVNL